MALLHQATLQPSKLEMLSAYLPTRSFLMDADLSDLTQIGSYRFDDPAGAVGIETHLLASSSIPVVHLPLTYRDSPLVGARDWLLGTMQHSVLGERWVYDGCGDPVYAAALLRTILTAGTQADLQVDTPEGRKEREPTAFVSGTLSSGAVGDVEVPAVDSVSVMIRGGASSLSIGTMTVVVRHLLDATTQTSADDQLGALHGTWAEVTEPVLLAYICD